jgi:ABC-2 type transport system permease protein
MRPIRLSAFVAKEFRQSFRDPTMLFLLVVLPVIQLSLYGYAVDLDVDKLPTVLCDLDGTPASRDLASRFFADRTFEIYEQALEPDAASRALERGSAAAALIVPAGYAAALQRGRRAEVQVLVDGTDPVRARVAIASAEQFFAAQAGVLATASTFVPAAQGRAAGRVHLEPRVLYNPQLKSELYMVPGALAAVLLVGTTQLIAMGIAREREKGTLEQVLVSPLGHVSLVLGKSLPFAALGLFNVGVLIGAGVLLFDLPMRGSALGVVLASALYLLSTLGVGLFIGTISKTQQQAVAGSIFFIVPAFLLSGYFTPIENMPEWLQVLSYADPMRYYLEILRGSMLKGASIGDFSMQLLVLGGFGITVFAVSARRFKRRLQHWSKGVADVFEDLKEEDLLEDLER